jgi:hypothetical protein
MWLLFTIFLSSGCEADGPFMHYDREGAYDTLCPDREVVQYETVVGFRGEGACRAEAERRWYETGWSTTSRCSRLDGR